MILCENIIEEYYKIKQGSSGSAVVMPLGMELWLLMQSIFSMHNA